MADCGDGALSNRLHITLVFSTNELNVKVQRTRTRPPDPNNDCVGKAKDIAAINKDNGE